MSKTHNKYSYSLSSDISFRNYNQLFIKEVHLFDCNEKAMLLLDILKNNENIGISSTPEGLREVINLIPGEENRKLTEDKIFSILEYLTVCNVLKKQTYSEIR